MSEEPPAALGADHGLTRPVRFRPVAHMGVQGGAGARKPMLIIGTRLVSARLDEGNEPVPVEQGHVRVRGGRGMPAQEVIVEGADLAGRVVVADIVIIGLRQRDVDRAENQHRDSQGSPAPPL